MTAGDPVARTLHQDRERIDLELESSLPPPTLPPPLLHEAMRYAVFAGGKRLRPLLVLNACRACGGDPQAATRVAAAVEMIHTYSLVHDDLPSMDDDSLRRGKPTTHVVYGEAMAILVGDALLTRAFEILAPGSGPAAPPAPVLLELAQAAGSCGMVGGQVLDLQAQGKSLGRIDLEDLHGRKTGALIQASVAAGGICAAAPDSQLQALRRFGAHLGLAFQITDDILDVTGSDTSLGKSAGKDIRARKSTFVALMGLEAAQREAQRHVAAATASLSAFGIDAGPLRHLAHRVGARTS